MLQYSQCTLGLFCRPHFSACAVYLGDRVNVALIIIRGQDCNYKAQFTSRVLAPSQVSLK